MPDPEVGAEVTLTVNGRTIQARPGELLIAAAERHGIYIPRFCWHPRMRSVGMCRMCLVEIEGPRGPAIQPACMQPVAEGMVVHSHSDVARKVQEGVLEYLLIHHPLDCPVCDRGGECPLQDETMTWGPGETRFVEEKRHYAKPIPVNALILLDRERCILCDRCVRFAKEVAGDPLLVFTERGNSTQVLTFPDQPFASYFSANTVQICPVGALTAVPYRFRARPWDLDQIESTCTTCAVGCRMVVQSTCNRLIRHLGVDADPVNWGWLCDKGRFAYQTIDSDDRLRHPLVRRHGELVEATWDEAFDVTVRHLHDVLNRAGPAAVAVLGGARLTNEDAYAWAKLAKAVIGTDNVDAQLADGLPPELLFGLPRATIDDACAARVVLLLGPDLKEELPVLYLRLRQAAIDGTAIVELTSRRSGLSPYAATTLLYRPGELDILVEQLLAEDTGGDSELSQARALLRHRNPVVVVGRPSPAEDERTVTAAAYTLAAGLLGVRFLPVVRRGNVHGALDMGLAPGFLPGRVTVDEGRDRFRSAWGPLPDTAGLDATGILRTAADGRIGALLLVGCDPLSDFPDRALARQALERASFVAATDLFRTRSTSQADIVFPAAGSGEKAGTTTNLEGRISRLGRKVTAPATSRPDWMIAVELADRLGADLGLGSLSDIWAEIEKLAVAHRGLTPQLLAEPGHRSGIVIPITEHGHAPRPERLPQETGAVGVGSNVIGNPPSITGNSVEVPPGELPHITEPEAATPDDIVGVPAAQRAHAGAAPGKAGQRRSVPTQLSRTALMPAGTGLVLATGRKLYDDGVCVQRSPALAELSPAAWIGVHPTDLAHLGLHDGDRVTVSSKRGHLDTVVKADPDLVPGCGWVPFNQPGGGAVELISMDDEVTALTIEPRT